MFNRYRKRNGNTSICGFRWSCMLKLFLDKQQADCWALYPASQSSCLSRHVWPNRPSSTEQKAKIKLCNPDGRLIFTSVRTVGGLILTLTISELQHDVFIAQSLAWYQSSCPTLRKNRNKYICQNAGRLLSHYWHRRMYSTVFKVLMHAEECMQTFCVILGKQSPQNKQIRSWHNYKVEIITLAEPHETITIKSFSCPLKIHNMLSLLIVSSLAGTWWNVLTIKIAFGLFSLLMVTMYTWT